MMHDTLAPSGDSPLQGYRSGRMPASEGGGMLPFRQGRMTPAKRGAMLPMQNESLIWAGASHVLPKRRLDILG